MTIFWMALMTALNGCLEILGTLLGTALAATFICFLIAALIAAAIEMFKCEPAAA
ncbi:hypothetical protein BLA6860_00258 [Burkholderia lata]|uniref:hypothetical protein n=1 Tax=Burkholderia lata (strain ATCC 17760 / DSM 23089 / LMG 22485 / NCIMB 9086 / R18194 / 383) TaxID=482957 RepID=UPI001453D2CC|nr:hypothetical protein [Burkholderia lata]VWB09400.1 hypothetical protein BLA6860_00258 [Burkholderia lata]